MRYHFIQSCVGIIAVAGPVVARPALEPIGSMPMSGLFPRADEFNPDDLSSIKKIAAVGDSYSAGIGAGVQLTGKGGEFVHLP